ncbi:hypothetical protein BS78_05G147800 [Paspalum vaginatum]|nr:hypothetical protein BS78_05G147800 [Paspalum vaginatum]
MEPNTSSSAAGTSTAATVDNKKDLTPEQVQTLISLLLTPIEMPNLLSASEHASLLSWNQQMLIQFSPAVGGGSATAVHAHATSSQQASTSMFPAVGELPPIMVDDIFAGQEPLAASTPVPTLLGGQPGQEGLAQPSPSTVPGLPQSSSDGVLGFAGQPAASGEISEWQSDMPLFSPSFGSDQLPLPLPLPQGDDDMVGIIPQPSSDYELAPLPESLCIPSLADITHISTYNMVSTDGGIMPWNCGGSSLDGVGSSISSVPDLTTGAMNPPVLPPVQASPHSGGTGSNFVGFGEPSSTLESELAPAVPSLQVPLVKVKQELVDATTATLCGPEFISLIDDGDEDELDLEAILNLVSDPEALLPEDELDLEPVLNSVPDPEGLPVLDTSCSLVGGPSSETVVALPEKNAISTMGSSSCAQSTHCHDGNVSMGVDTSSSTAKQTCSLPPLPPSSIRAGASSSRRYATIGLNLFTDAEMEIIMKDKHLKELWIADPKRVKRILCNRMSAAKAKARIVNHTMDLERRFETLEIKRKTLCEQLQSLKDGTSELKSQHKEMMMMKEQLEEQTKLKDAVNGLLKIQIQNLNLIMISALQMMNSKMPDGSGSHVNAHQEISPHMVELQQLQVQEQSTEQWQAHAEHVDDTFTGDQHIQDF